jgi:hypothetical protein
MRCDAMRVQHVDIPICSVLSTHGSLTFPFVDSFSFRNAHSGTVLDLPYRFSADDTKMRLDRAFNMKSLMSKLGGNQNAIMAMCGCLMYMLLSGNN